MSIILGLLIGIFLPIFIISLIIYLYIRWKERRRVPVPEGEVPAPERQQKEGFLGIKKEAWKKIYQISGALAALLIIYYLWNKGDPVTFSAVWHMKRFWGFNILFLANLALLEKTTLAVSFIRTATLLLTIFLLLSFLIPLFRGGPEFIAEFQDSLVHGTVERNIEEVRRYHKDALVFKLLQEINALKETAKISPLSENELKRLNSLEERKDRILERERKERILSGFFRLVPGKVASVTTEGQKLNVKKGERVKFTQIGTLGKFWIINDTIPSYKVTEKEHITRPTISDGKIQLEMAGDKGEVLIQAQIVH